MSSQRGNLNRTRPQKHRNVTAFKNNLHDTSKKIKALNALQFDNVCAKCKAILEWKVKYKKYKPLKSAKTCVKCNEKTIKEAYHTMCEKCALANKVCPKCGKDKNDTSIEVNNSSMSEKFNELVLEKSKATKQESSDESYDRESSSDYDHDSESLISSDCDNSKTK
ncbi:uncharacterized protein C9orf85 homolog [Diaphorina citri]|jgi:Uncharacterized conserved protein (DUF2039).|uniref:Uncharacterized protein C9orf85 homolog n=1 Tax=Diaphorina citri TaxID=121845 RepID=A0A1S3CZ51_DIACI|nr:uncharacterized protein C9orf85 homolog [Diaphorina citri]KAI5712838.1 hypothetical protein M8J75_011621 [Diaphorina citri]KAI5749004.1 hypothetical protein M8J76_003921 [Diaphorina citri]KAI5754547.1 hypothetical protein M8J77_009419 [Diaphorina citri]